MAGGKETPRQKLIGMMYLVLMALLALQVSNAVIEKFYFIDQSLEKSAQVLLKENQGRVKAIEDQVAKRENREADVAVLGRAEMVREKTEELITYLDDLKELFIQETGGYQDGKPKNMTDEAFVAGHMVGKKNAEELQKQINSWADEISEIAGIDSRRIIKSPGEMEQFANDKDQRNKSYAEFAFAHTPMIAAQAQLSQYENEILSFEGEALNSIAAEIGADEVRFDQIVPVVLPESNTVASGATYSARMFIAASSSSGRPTYFLDGDSLQVDDSTGYGIVEFKASASDFVDGRAEKTFLAKIEYNGKEYEQPITYYVTQPVIQVQAAAVSALYLNCGNELVVTVPALGAAYEPSFTAEGGRVVGGEGGNVTIIPTARKVTLNVSSGGNYIGNREFNVRRVPKPTIALVDQRGRPINELQGVTQAPRSITLNAVPDESFAEFLPKDARFRVTRYEVILARGSRAVARKVVTQPQANLSDFARQARAGDRIVIDVKEVQRMNFQGNTEPVGMGTVVKNIPING